MKQGNVLILSASIVEPFNLNPYRDFYSCIPQPVLQRIKNYYRTEDKVAGIAGKQLLLHALTQSGFGKKHFETLQYNKNNRPYLKSLPFVDFNISHTDSMVVLALSTKMQVGIDIEKEKPVNIINYIDQFSSYQWEEIENSPAPEKLFYNYWVQKESVFKGYSSDSPVSFSEIEIHSNRAVINDKTFYLTRLDIAPSYCSWLASENIPDIVIEELLF